MFSALMVASRSMTHGARAGEWLPVLPLVALSVFATRAARRLSERLGPWRASFFFLQSAITLGMSRPRPGVDALDYELVAAGLAAVGMVLGARWFLELREAWST
jgi:hypothetical protein